jgi:hypothetical protein
VRKEPKMSKSILVPWAMPEPGKEVLRRSKVAIVFLHGPKGELPSLKELMNGVKNADEEKSWL